MAKVRKKENNRGWWPWLLGVGILAVIVVGVAALSSRPYVPLDPSQNSSAGDQMSYGVVERADDASPAAGANRVVPEKVQQYLQYIAKERVRDRAGPDDQFISYAANGVWRLAAAIGAVMVADSALAAELEGGVRRLQIQAAAMEHTPDPAAAVETRNAFLIATNLLERVYRAKYGTRSGPEIIAVRRMAESVQPELPLIGQRPAVMQFLDQAGLVLRAIASRRVRSPR